MPILIDVLRGQTDSSNPVNLSSNSMGKRLHKGFGLPLPGLDDFDPSFIPKTKTFSYIRKLTGNSFDHEVPKLMSIEKQDILSWIREFKEAKEVCNFEDTITLNNLIWLSTLEIQKII